MCGLASIAFLLASATVFTLGVVSSWQAWRFREQEMKMFNDACAFLEQAHRTRDEWKFAKMNADAARDSNGWNNR